MGEVYRATDTRLGRDVAVKLLPEAFAEDPERLARFEREAKLLAALNHPAVAHLYGLEQAEGQRFLVLELAEGEDLQARIARGPVPLEEAIAIAKQVAAGLEAAHEKGIVHRDLKPANVKVDPAGQVKVLDFGLAKAWAGDATGAISGSDALSLSPTLTRGGTKPGLLLGTAAYMAPEQARGKPVDKRADIWAFGALLYEMLAGRRLFVGETITDVLAAVVRQEIDWTALPEATPQGFRRLLRRCLERDPKLRLRDIGEARVALSALDEPEAFAPAPALVSRRSAAALVAGAGVGAALGFGLGRRGPRGGSNADARHEPLSVTRITASGNVTSAAISPDGRLVAYVEAEQGEQSLWLRQVATGQTLRLIPGRTAAYWGFTFTRDGNSIVFGLKGPDDPDGSFHSISTLGGVTRRLATGIDSAPGFSPDGSRMAWMRSRHPSPDESALVVAKADGSDARVVAAIKQPDRLAPIFFTAPDWSPDGKRIACSVVRSEGGTVDAQGKLVAVSVDDGRVETLASPGWSSAAQVAWLPDASGLLAVASGELADSGQIWFVPLPQGAPRRVTNDLLNYRIVSLTADGRSLVTVAADLLASVWLSPRDAGSRPRRLTNAKFDGIFGLDFAPDGRLVYTTREGGVDGLWVTRADASERSPLAAGDGVLREPQVTRSAQVYYLARTRSGAEIRRISLDGSAPQIVLTGALGGKLGTVGGGLAISPDERLIAFTAVRDGESRLFRVPVVGGTPEPVSDHPAQNPAFSRDGRQIAFYYRDRASYRIGIAPAEGGGALRSVEAEPPAGSSRIVFRDEGLYLNTMPGDRANVWLRPLDGAPARRLTEFQEHIIYNFALSPDGRSLAYSRGPLIRDAMLIRGFA